MPAPPTNNEVQIAIIIGGDAVEIDESKFGIR